MPCAPANSSTSSAETHSGVGWTVLADHLGTGDYAITRAVFAAVLVTAIVIAVVSIAKSAGWSRVAGLALSITLLFVAVRMHFRWEDITDVADHLTGPRGGDRGERVRLGWTRGRSGRE